MIESPSGGVRSAHHWGFLYLKEFIMIISQGEPELELMELMTSQELSFKQKGMIATLFQLYKEQGNLKWVAKADLSEISNDGIEAIRRISRTLIKKRYIQIIKVRDSFSKIVRSGLWVIFLHPDREKIDLENYDGQIREFLDEEEIWTQ